MGQAVHDHAFANGYTVVREIGGHGVGLEFHEEPWVGYNTKRGQEMLMVPGMIFTIEPMVNMGKVDIYVDSMQMTGKFIRRTDFRLHSGRLWCL